MSYGSFQAVRDINLEVREGELVVLLGANGAGKTTVFRAVSGLTRADAGSRIEFGGRDLSRLSPRAIVDAGMSHCPEGRKLFPALSVLTNLRLGAYRCRDRAEIERRLDARVPLFPMLTSALGQAGRVAQRRAAADGGDRPGADGRAARAAARRAVGEPGAQGGAAGAGNSCGRSTAPVQWCSSRSRTRYAALEIAHRGYVLENGRIVLEGSAAELMQHDEVRRAYMGA